MVFEYLDQNFKTKAQDMSIVQNLLSNQKGVFMDPKYLPVIEEAEKGNIDALAEMAEAFSNGLPGVKPNYELAMHFAKKIYEKDQLDNNSEVILNDLQNFAAISAQFEKWEEARKWQLKTVRFMVMNFDPESWNHENFDNLEACIYQLSPELFSN